MSKVKVKYIKDKAMKINDGWEEGAPTIEFGKIKQADFSAELESAALIEQEISDLERQISLKEAERDDAYLEISNKSVLIANGVRGDADYGPDSPLYGAMGFVRTSERASGLTRKKKEETEE